MTGLGLFVWRGLKTEAPDGKLVHVFPLDVKGSEEAADAVFACLQEGKGGILNRAIVDAFLATQLWKPRGDSPGEDIPKNQTT
jgi:hypothetical protein